MSLTTAIGRTLFTFVLAAGLAAPAAAGIDRGIGVEPSRSVASTADPDMIDRYLARQDRSGRVSLERRNAVDARTSVPTEQDSELTRGIVAATAAGSFAFGATAAALVLRRRRTVAS